MNRAVVPVPVIRKQFEQGDDGCVEITGNGVADRADELLTDLVGRSADFGGSINEI